MDHPFWESFEEDTPVHWDQIAAQYVGSTANPVPVHTEDFNGVAFHPFTDKTGTPLPWRNCVGSYYSPPGNGQMFFSTLSVPIDPQGTCTGHDRAGLHEGQLPGDPRLLRLHPLHAVDAGAPQLAGALLHRPAVPGAGGRVVKARLRSCRRSRGRTGGSAGVWAHCADAAQVP